MRDIALFLFQFIGQVLKTAAGAAAVAVAVTVLTVSALLCLHLP